MAAEADDGGWGSTTQGLSACDVDVEDGATLTAEAFARGYIVRERPVLIRNATHGAASQLRASLSKAQLLASFGDLEVGVGPAPHYEAADTRRMVLREYVQAMEATEAVEGVEAMEAVEAQATQEGAAAMGASSSSSPPAPPTTTTTTTSSVRGAAEPDYLFLGLRGATNAEHARLESLLRSEQPPLLTEALRAGHLHYQARTQFSLGPAGSGSPPHFHMAAFNTLVYGRKRWTLMPPRGAVYAALPVRQWHAAGGVHTARAEGREVLECVQHAGDVLYVPDHWGHAVLNEALSVGFASECATARGAAMQMVLEG
jgi:hypothetical protein